MAKKYYSIFMLIFSLTVTLILTICAIIYRINSKLESKFTQTLVEPLKKPELNPTAALRQISSQIKKDGQVGVQNEQNNVQSMESHIKK